MPNGDPDFDREALERYFAPVASVISEFARRHNLVLDKYYHDSPSWALRFNHPKGGYASLAVQYHTDDAVKISSVWYVDEYDRFTRSIHWRAARTVPRTSEGIGPGLSEELRTIVGVQFGDWNQIATGYEGVWSRFTKEEFNAMAPRLSDPVLDSDV